MKYLSIITFVIVFSTSACNMGQVDENCIDNDWQQPDVQSDSAVAYFPRNSLFFTSDGKNIRSDSFIKTTLSIFLYNMKEPVLNSPVDSLTVLRILWVPARGGDPSIIRMQKCHGIWYAKIRSLAGVFDGLKLKGYRLSLDTTLKIDSPQVYELLKSTEIKNFLELPSANTTDDKGYKDLDMWVMEGTYEGHYNSIIRSVINDSSLTQYPIASELKKILFEVVKYKPHR